VRDPASALYVGRIRHRRHQAPAMAFSHSYWQVLIDLDELPELDRTVGLFGHNRRAVLSFDDRDHMGPEPRPVRDKLASWMAGRGLTLPDGPVRLLTGLRHFGWGFNPVSFFFCHDADGAVRWVVAEVNNTFGETYPYLLEAAGPAGRVRDEQPKVFHVSPFFPVDGAYRFAVAPPGRALSVHIELHRDGAHALDATLTGERRPLTGGTLGRALLRHPHQTARTVGLIHWHALKLWLRRARFHSKPAPPAGAWETHHG
jgi:DUF1365 family protein